VRTEELIVRLAADAAPVRRLPSISVRLVRWLLVAVPVVAVFVAAVGPRSDLATRAAAPAFLVSVLAVAALALVSAGAALVSSVPGHRRSRLAVAGPLLILVWATALYARLAAGGSVGTQLITEPSHAACILQISLMAVLPAVVLLRSVRGGASVAPGWSGMLTLAAALGAGAVGSAIICPIDRAAHEAVWHWLPVASLAAAGLVAGKIWFSHIGA
jgi:hypothetical protein